MNENKNKTVVINQANEIQNKQLIKNINLIYQNFVKNGIKCMSYCYYPVGPYKSEFKDITGFDENKSFIILVSLKFYMDRYSDIETIAANSGCTIACIKDYFLPKEKIECKLILVDASKKV